MTYNPAKHHCRSIRLKGYDYSQSGLYFITICCQNKACIFGHIENGIMIMNHAGQMVENEWLRLPQRFHNIQSHEFIVMPNHFHAILEIVGSTPTVDQNITNPVGSTLVVDLNNIDNGQPQGIAPTIAPTTENPTEKTIGEIVGAFKSITTVEYVRGVKKNNWQAIDKRLWQRNYHEHIIRNEQSYINISNYIINNPVNWDEDVLQ
ncbi:MAG: transposase [Bacteroidia bacterium]|nr:transposase [Bacteroidia bacterium]